MNKSLRLLALLLLPFMPVLAHAGEAQETAALTTAMQLVAAKDWP